MTATHPTAWWGPRWAQVLLLLILAASAATYARAFRGYVGLDDAEYAHLAYEIARGTFHPGAYHGPVVFPLRVGVLVPAAAVYYAFGLTEWSTVLYPFVVALLSIALVYACATMLFGHRSGLIAAVLMAILPWHIDSATKLLPDLPAAFFATLAVAVLILVGRRRVAGRGALLAWGGAAGLALGASWLCKESVAYLAPFFLVALILTVRREGPRMWLFWIGLAAASLGVLAGEMLTYYHLHGDLLFRFHQVEVDYRQNAKYFFTEGSAHGWSEGGSRWRAVANRVFVSGPSTLFLDPSLLYLPLMAAIATLYGWVRRERTFLLPAIWFWTLAFMFDFGSSSVTEYIPLALFQRYLYLLYYPSIVLAAGFLARTLLPSRAPGVAPRAWTPAFRLVGLAMAATIVWVGGRQALYDVRHPQTWWLDDVRAVRGQVTPETVLFADTLSLRALEFFDRYPAHTRWTDFDQVPAGAQLPGGSLVMVNKRYLQWLHQHGGIWGSRRTGYPVLAFYDRAPASWTVVWQNSNLSLYRVGGPGPRASAR